MYFKQLMRHSKTFVVFRVSQSQLCFNTVLKYVFISKQHFREENIYSKQFLSFTQQLM